MGHYFQEQIAGSELTIDPRAGHLTTPKWHAAEILSRFTASIVPQSKLENIPAQPRPS
jgi:hypothetical protein